LPLRFFCLSRVDWFAFANVRIDHVPGRVRFLGSDLAPLTRTRKNKGTPGKACPSRLNRGSTGGEPLFPAACKPDGLSFLSAFLCTIIFENKRFGKGFGCGTKYENVAAHAQGPPNFPHRRTALAGCGRRTHPTS